MNRTNVGSRVRWLAIVVPIAIWGLAADGSPAVQDGASMSEGREGPGLTVYSGNLALARWKVDRILESGVQTVRVDGLPSNVDPTSIAVLSGDVTLLGTHSMRTYQDPGAGAGASIELDIEVGRRVEGLDLVFLTAGLSWSADYVVLLAADDGSARIDGYASVSNNSGTRYENAEVQLLAGVVRGIGGGRFADADLRVRALEAAAEPPSLGEATFGDYHLYTVSTPLTLGNGESRRIRLLGAARATTRKEYVLSHVINHFRSYPEPLRLPVNVEYVIERDANDEFGSQPLPAGQVRVFQPDATGRVQLVGVVPISNTPEGERIRLQVGQAFDIVGTRTQTDFQRVSGNTYESSWEVELVNRRGEEVTVQVIDQIGGDWEILESSHRWERLSASTVRFAVRVPADGQGVLEYRIRVKS